MYAADRDPDNIYDSGCKLSQNLQERYGGQRCQSASHAVAGPGELMAGFDRHIFTSPPKPTEVVCSGNVYITGDTLVHEHSIST